jgi:DNA mismatch repair protein MutL
VTVRILDDRVVDQIAAGEVVERPASVVKEVVENAIDAGASRLIIRLRNGGIAAIEVVDDGDGMSRADAMLCVERHATSKVRVAEDLVGVTTFGFRGEALAAIGAVADLRIRTRRAEDELGTEVVVEAGRMVSVSEVVCAKGTELSVRGLFANIPARRKFLRTKQTELDHAVEAVRRALMLRPDVGVVLTHDGHEVLRSEAGALASRARDLMGADAEVLVPVEAISGRVRVTGLVAPPGVHRPSATGSVYTYVNGRFVRDPVLRRALNEAWRGVLPPGRAPVAVLAVEVPGEDVDVNVHPQKTEVRFQDARGVSEAVATAARDALREAAGVRRPTAKRPDGPLLDAAWTPSIPALPPEGLFPPRSPQSSWEVEPPAAVDEPPRWGAAVEESAPLAASPAATSVPATLAAVADLSPRAPGAAPVPAAKGEAVVSPAQAPVVDEPDAPPRWRDRPLVGVHAGRWAAVSEGEDLVLVDLDGVRRGDLATELSLAGARGELAARPRLVPARVELSRGEVTALLSEAEPLAAHGVEIHALGPGMLALGGSPAVIVAEPAALLRALAARPGAPAEAMAAVTALPPLDEAAARGLLARLDEAPSLAAGRVVRLAEAELRRRLGDG